MGFGIYISEERAVAFVMLLAFLITFALTRLYTRIARARGWGSAHAGAVHIHHMVVGIVFILLAGFFGIALEPGHPWIDLLGILFGVGAAFTLDEFALWLHVRDVYWAEEGRSSVDAVILATLLGGLIVLGVTPFGLAKSAGADVIAATCGLAVGSSLVALLKGKFLLGIAGLFIPFLAYAAAIRLARPRSPWARWRYSGNEKKMAKAIARDEKREARKIRVRDFLGGAPSLKSPQP